MKPKIKFTTLEEQADQSAYWKTKSYAERLAEGFRLTQKAYWQYYSQQNPTMELRSGLIVKLPDETLEEFFTRKNRSR